MSATIAALASGNSAAAVSIIRLSGDACAAVFKRALGINAPVARKMIRAKYRDCNNEILDDVLAVYFRAPASYTGEDCAEIYCHGSPYIVQKILQDLFKNECEPAQAGEFTRRAFLNNKMDLSQAEAVALIIGARSKAALDAAQRQLEGELGKRIGDFSKRLVDACALTEAYIDFPEDDLPDEDKNKLLDSCRELCAKIRALASTSEYCALVHNGINTVIVGEPNAGKSSLLNALTGDERAIVSPQAGTTRDFICEKIILEDYALNIIDTAGLRACGNQIESMGVEMAIKKVRSADIRLLAIDSASNPSDFRIPEEVKGALDKKNTIVVLNKCDLPNANPAAFEKIFPDFCRIEMSCLTLDGLDRLKRAVVELIKSNYISAAADDILVSARHADALLRAANAIDCAAAKICQDAPSELVASDLRCALDAIGEIVGKTDNEAILDKIFSSFCIGK